MVFFCAKPSVPSARASPTSSIAQATRKVQGEMLREARKVIKAASRATAPHGIARKILAGVEPEASAETPRRSTPALTPALKEAARAAHSDEVPETSPPSKEQGEVVDALALMRKRLQAKEQRVIQKQKELEAYMKKDAARVRNIKKARKELLEQERRESERLLAEERAKDAEPWPPPYLDAIVV